MIGFRVFPQIVRTTAAALCVLAVATGCSTATSARPRTEITTPVASAPANSPSADTGAGQTTAKGPTTNLVITDAAAHVDAAGNGELTMVVRNDSSVPEHLAAVTTRGGAATLVGVGDNNGSLSPAGILLNPATTTTFGDSGPRILLHGTAGVLRAKTLPLLLEFGVAGLVHLQARVVGA